MSTGMFIVKRENSGITGVTRFTGIDDEGVNEMIGQLLTQLEASSAPGPQLDALKSLVKQTVWKSMSHGQITAYEITDTSKSGEDRVITAIDPWYGPGGSAVPAPWVGVAQA